jgi:UDP-N-acetyl-D-mannosaminuronate dehydrogenase
LKEKSVEAIQNREMRMMVVGSGYVGLPTAALFADAGFQVTVVDVKPEIVKDINEGLIARARALLNRIVRVNFCLPSEHACVIHHTSTYYIMESVRTQA